MEQPRAKYRLMGQGGKSYRIVSFAKTKALLPAWNQTLLSAVTAGPANEWYWVIGTQSTDPAVTDSILHCHAEIYYTVTFYERNEFNSS